MDSERLWRLNEGREFANDLDKRFKKAFRDNTTVELGLKTPITSSQKFSRRRLLGLNLGNEQILTGEKEFKEQVIDLYQTLDFAFRSLANENFKLLLSILGIKGVFRVFRRSVGEERILEINWHKPAKDNRSNSQKYTLGSSGTCFYVDQNDGTNFSGPRALPYCLELCNKVEKKVSDPQNHLNVLIDKVRFNIYPVISEYMQGLGLGPDKEVPPFKELPFIQKLKVFTKTDFNDCIVEIPKLGKCKVKYILDEANRSRGMGIYFASFTEQPEGSITHVHNWVIWQNGEAVTSKGVLFINSHNNPHGVIKDVRRLVNSLVSS